MGKQEKKVRKAIKDYRDRLTRKAERRGIWENFGQEEVRTLEDQFHDHQYPQDDIWKLIREFDEWCQTYIE